MRAALALTATPFCVAVATVSVTSVPPADALRLASGRIPVTSTATGPPSTAAAPSNPHPLAPGAGHPYRPATALGAGHPHHPVPAGCGSGLREVPPVLERASPPDDGTAALRGAARDTQVSLVLLALALVARAVFMRRRRPGPPAGPSLAGRDAT